MKVWLPKVFNIYLLQIKKHMKLIWYVWTEGWHVTQVVETRLGPIEFYLN